jgi:hypothetical protein
LLDSDRAADIFDFSDPQLDIPELPPAVIDPEKLSECHQG